MDRQKRHAEQEGRTDWENRTTEQDWQKREPKTEMPGSQGRTARRGLLDDC
jgi:hypothetical protein